MTCTTKGCERPVYSEYAKRCRPCDAEAQTGQFKVGDRVRLMDYTPDYAKRIIENERKHAWADRIADVLGKCGVVTSVGDFPFVKFDGAPGIFGLPAKMFIHEEVEAVRDDSNSYMSVADAERISEDADMLYIIVRTDSHIKGMEAQQMLTLQDMTNEQLAAFMKQAMTEQEERLIECARELESASFQH